MPDLHRTILATTTCCLLALPVCAQQSLERPVTESAAAAPEAQGQCNPNRTKFRSETDNINTMSLTYVQALKIAVNTGSSNCIIVDFSVDAWHPDPDEWIFVRARIPGIADTIALPDQFVLDGQREDSRTVQFVFPDVPAGKHKVLIEYHSYQGAAVELRTRMATVQYRS